MKELTCDKCGSHSITDSVLDFPKEVVEEVKMSEYKGNQTSYATTTGLICYQHRLECKDCGFTCGYMA